MVKWYELWDNQQISLPSSTIMELTEVVARLELVGEDLDVLSMKTHTIAVALTGLLGFLDVTLAE